MTRKSAKKTASDNVGYNPEIADLLSKLQIEKDRNKNLEEEKTRLSSEVEELTKVLFEEANTMVASETRAKRQIELAHKKLQSEHACLLERFQLESLQLEELRQKLQSEDNLRPSSSLVFSIDTLRFDYMEDLFPGRKLCFPLDSGVWTKVIDAINQLSFDSFSRMLNEMSELRSDEELLRVPFMTSIMQEDLGPCLQFYSKSKNFVRRIVLAMLANRFCIETDVQKMSSTSDLKSESNDLYEHTPASDRSFPNSPQRIRTMMSTLTFSVSSIPDNIIPQSFHLKERRVQKGLCVLCCGAAPRHRYRIEENSEWYAVCDYCRNRLVAAGNLLTFIRHLKQNVYSTPMRSLIELYLECAQYRRACFYARSDGLASFYILSDFLQLNRAVLHSNFFDDRDFDIKSHIQAALADLSIDDKPSHGQMSREIDAFSDHFSDDLEMQPISSNRPDFKMKPSSKDPDYFADIDSILENELDDVSLSAEFNNVKEELTQAYKERYHDLLRISIKSAKTRLERAKQANSKNWFMEPNHQTCPHCRTPLTLRQLTDAQYMDQARELANIKHAATESHQLPFEDARIKRRYQKLAAGVGKLEKDILELRSLCQYNKQFIPPDTKAGNEDEVF